MFIIVTFTALLRTSTYDLICFQDLLQLQLYIARIITVTRLCLLLLHSYVYYCYSPEFITVTALCFLLLLC